MFGFKTTQLFAQEIFQDAEIIKAYMLTLKKIDSKPQSFEILIYLNDTFQYSVFISNAKILSNYLGESKPA